MTRKYSGQKTAADFIAELESDPVYLAKRAQLDRDRLKHQAEFAKHAAPILAALAHAGLNIESLNDLKLKAVNYRPQLRILLDFIPRITNPSVKVTVIRSLARKEAKPGAAPTLIKEFWDAESTAAKGSHIRWVIGNSLDVVADDSVFNGMAEIARDRSMGADRQMVVRGLKNMRNPAAIDVLIGLLDDVTVAGHALMALRLMGATEARSAIEPFLLHEETWWRNEAKKAIAKFDKLETRNK